MGRGSVAGGWLGTLRYGGRQAGAGCGQSSGQTEAKLRDQGRSRASLSGCSAP